MSGYPDGASLHTESEGDRRDTPHKVSCARNTLPLHVTRVCRDPDPRTRVQDVPGERFHDTVPDGV